MRNVEIVVRELQEKYRQSRKPYLPEEINWTLSPRAERAWREFLRTRGRTELVLDEFVRSELARDIATPETIDRTLVLTAICPEPTRNYPIISTFDVEPSKQRKRYIRLLEHPEKISALNYRVACSFCRHDQRESMYHTPSHVYTRYTSGDGRIEWNRVDQLFERLQIALFHEDHPAYGFDPDLKCKSPEEMTSHLLRLGEKVQTGYGTVVSDAVKSGKPLVAATTRIRKDPIRKVLRMVENGEETTPFSSVRCIVAPEYDRRALTTEMYATSLHDRLSGIRGVSLLEEPSLFKREETGLEGYRFAVEYDDAAFSLQVISFDDFKKDHLSVIRCMQEKRTFHGYPWDTMEDELRNYV